MNYGCTRENLDSNAVHTEDGISRLQMENQLAVPGDGKRDLHLAQIDRPAEEDFLR